MGDGMTVVALEGKRKAVDEVYKVDPARRTAAAAKMVRIAAGIDGETQRAETVRTAAGLADGEEIPYAVAVAAFWDTTLDSMVALEMPEPVAQRVLPEVVKHALTALFRSCELAAGEQ